MLMPGLRLRRMAAAAAAAAVVEGSSSSSSSSSSGGLSGTSGGGGGSVSGGGPEEEAAAGAGGAAAEPLQLPLALAARGWRGALLALLEGGAPPVPLLHDSALARALTVAAGAATATAAAPPPAQALAYQRALLDAMTMVGSVSKAGLPVALLRVDNLLYQVKAGDHLGQNYGRIVRITETEVVLREIVQDAAGEWIERNATLQLQERGQEAPK